MNEKEESKTCLKCGVSKELKTDFYKAGKFWQSLCKVCHNKIRLKYKNNSNYIKRPKGFTKLSEETQKNIINDIATCSKDARINYKQIARKNNINYSTLILWKRAGTIPVQTAEVNNQV